MMQSKRPPFAAMLGLGWLLLIPGLLLGNPYADATRAALADLGRVQPASRPYTRYLALTGATARERRDEAVAASYTLNAVSRTRLISPPVIIGPSLLRVDLSLYADPDDPASLTTLSREWERLATVDPYFHIRGEFLADGEIVRQTVDGGWVDLGSMATVQHATDSTGPILRADWFVCRVAGRGRTYYAWAGIPGTEAELLSTLGIDQKVVSKLAADSAANLFISGVTHKARRVIRVPGPLGGYWRTKDVATEAPNKDPIRAPVDFAGQTFEFDAIEVFFQRQNQLWGTALFNAAGQRQNAVPANVALDRYGQGGAGEIAPLVTCIRCHEREGSGGMQSFRDVQVTLPLGEYTDPQVARRILELYDPPRLAREMTRDAVDYAVAVANATHGYVVDQSGQRGMTTSEAAECLSATLSRHLYLPVTLDTVAAEFSLPVERVEQALAGSRDPVTISLRIGTPVTRAAYESAFSDIALLLGGIQ